MINLGSERVEDMRGMKCRSFLRAHLFKDNILIIFICCCHFSHNRKPLLRGIEAKLLSRKWAIEQINSERADHNLQMKGPAKKRERERLRLVQCEKEIVVNLACTKVELRIQWRESTSNDEVSVHRLTTTSGSSECNAKQGSYIATVRVFTSHHGYPFSTLGSEELCRIPRRAMVQNCGFTEGVTL